MGKGDFVRLRHAADPDKPCVADRVLGWRNGRMAIGAWPGLRRSIALKNRVIFRLLAFVSTGMMVARWGQSGSYRCSDRSISKSGMKKDGARKSEMDVLTPPN